MEKLGESANGSCAVYSEFIRDFAALERLALPDSRKNLFRRVSFRLPSESAVGIRDRVNRREILSVTRIWLHDRIIGPSSPLWSFRHCDVKGEARWDIVEWVSRVRQCGASTGGCSRCGAWPRLDLSSSARRRAACAVYTSRIRARNRRMMVGHRCSGELRAGEEDHVTPRRTILARADNRPGNSTGNGACSRGASS